jgi:glucose/arabinose dehydrogenase
MSAATPSPKLTKIADGFSFPSSLTFDDEGTAYVAESGVPFAEGAPPARVWRVGCDGTTTLLADDLATPLNGLTFFAGALYVSCGDDPGQIVRLDDAGRRDVVVDGLPGPGNYHVGMLAAGSDGMLYFGQGSMTNSGVIGLDAYELGWLRRLPHAHDVPGFDVTLNGFNATTPDPFSDDPGATLETGAFMGFGETTARGQAVAAGLPCTASVMRCKPDGSELELVAWGLRNPYGLGFLPDGRLIATDQSADDRGSRPIGNVPELLYEVKMGCWYGWPDFIGGRPVTDPIFRPERGAAPSFVLANHDELPTPEQPLLRFPAHASAVKFDVAPSTMDGHGGQLFVCLFGDERPMTAPEGPRAGRSVVRVDPATWTVHDFVSNPLCRPIDLRFRPTDGAMHVLDFGGFEMVDSHTVSGELGSGALWRIEP